MSPVISVKNSTQSIQGKLYWDEILAESCRGAPLDAWRSYMQQIYRRLLRDWLPGATSGFGLKTDLFEEAVSPHYLLSDLGQGSVGIDCSPAIVQAACRRLQVNNPQHLLIVGELRQLPLKAGAIKRVLAGSSLDHFPNKSDITKSLLELARVLAPGGTLVITFDNPHNPVVWLRNLLPFVWLNRLGLVPYYVGKTYTRTEARKQLKAVGLTVTDETAVAHAPRAPAIWLVMLVERLGWPSLQSLIARFLDSSERLERWPTRYRTGYYIALRAQKGRRGDPPCDTSV